MIQWTFIIPYRTGVNDSIATRCTIGLDARSHPAMNGLQTKKLKKMPKRKPKLIFRLQSVNFQTASFRNDLGRTSRLTPKSGFVTTSHHCSKVKERLSGWFLQSPAWTAARNKVDPWPHGGATPDERSQHLADIPFNADWFIEILMAYNPCRTEHNPLYAANNQGFGHC